MRMYEERVFAQKGKRRTASKAWERPLLRALMIITYLVMFVGEVSAGKRPWEPQDSVALTYIAVDPEHPMSRHLRIGVGDDRKEGSPVVISPDGQYFFSLSTRGDLEADANVCELNVFRVRSVLERLSEASKVRERPLPPYRRVELRSFSSLVPAIESPKWDPDGHSIVFHGTVEDDAQQIYRLDIESGRLDRLTSIPHRSSHGIPGGIQDFALRGNGLLYEDVLEGEIPRAVYPAELVERREEDGSIWRAPDDLTQRRMKHNLYASYRGQAGRKVMSAERRVGGSWPVMDEVSFSPDGRFAIVLVHTWIREKVVPPLTLRFVLLDVENAREVALPVATIGDWSSAVGHYPTGDLFRPKPKAFWSDDGTHVILVNVIVSKPGGASISAGDGTSYIIDYEIGSGRWQILEPLIHKVASGAPKYVSAVGWLRAGKELLVMHQAGNKPREGTVYALNRSGVVRRTVDAAKQVPQVSMAAGLSIRLVQGPNEPPRLVASNGRRETLLSASDPALRGVSLLRTVPFSWREPDGNTNSGGLTLPQDFAAGKPVPLVIQAYYYEPQLFLPDGPHHASDAAQSLAARGMAVLQIDAPMNPVLPGKLIGPGPLMVTRVESAVEALVSEGIVDASRVGLTGWSQSGFYTYYAITHPGRVRVVAAVAADFYDGTYPGYLFARGLGAGMLGFEAGPGGSFWKNKAAWLEYDPSFNVNRIQTPLLISIHGSGGHPNKQRDRSSTLQMIGAFALNDKPLEYLYLPQGEHALVRPRERLALMEEVVDWMAFWLQDYEDPSPHKAVKYARWRPMRAQQKDALTRVVGK